MSILRRPLRANQSLESPPALLIIIGKVADLGTDYPVLTNVFYIQTTVNQETKQQSNTLVKRGKEWHAPDKMVLNARHIIMIEPVTEGSTVAKLIAQAGGK
jgi:hypothetical protein